MSKPLVLLAGITGRTAMSIVDALLADGGFRIAGLSRTESLNKPELVELKAKGIEIRIGDISSDGVAKLTTILQDVDILILTVQVLVDQRDVLRAAKEAGVKRVVPSEFGPPAPPNVTEMQDKKLAIRKFIKDLGLPYTFIQVGWWAQFLTPYPHNFEIGSLETFLNQFMGEGKVKVAYTALPSIGKFVAKIITDPRTLNQTIMTWDGETTLEEAWSVAEKVSGEDFSDYRRDRKLSENDVKERAKSSVHLIKTWYEYQNTLYFRGDNTVAKGVEAGALDARKLYPDYKAPTLEELVREFYAKPPLYS